MRYAIALLGVLALAVLDARTLRLETDFAAFLPPSATPEERLLIAQLRDGLVSRLMLVALQGGDETTLAHASQALAHKLGHDPAFDYVANGSMEQFAAQGDVLLRYRYVLSPQVQVGTDRFGTSELRSALEESLAQLASPLGVLSRNTVTRDPTGEFLAALRMLDAGSAPALRNGVWFSPDGKHALLIAQTHAAGFDSERQGAAMAKLRDALAQVNPRLHAVLSGPGVFAAQSREVIRNDSMRLGLWSTSFILLMLAFVYRSPLPVMLVVVPTILGLLAGLLVVQILFGSVHAITLGFAVTLIGESVDYPSYVLLNTKTHETARSAAGRVGGTLALAVLTTVASALALALSSFTGLAQLGLLTMVGVIVAGVATHRLIPWLLGERVLDFPRFRIPAQIILANPRWPSAVALATTFSALLWLLFTHPAWWERDLANISPVPVAMRALDANLRREIGAPEVGIFLANRGSSEAAAIEAAEDILPLLEQWKVEGLIRTYDSPARMLPSPRTQLARLHALPDAETLQEHLHEALRGLPFRPDAFAPFVQDVAAARAAAPITRAAFAGTPLGTKLNAQVVELDGQWLVLTSIGGVSDAGRLKAVLALMPQARTQLIDLKQISSNMLDGFRREALRQALWGVGLIVVLLIAGLRSVERTVRVASPVAAALAITAAILVASGAKLSVFHLVALLLVLGIGLNYGLFFERPQTDALERERTRVTLAVCSLSTIATFGFLSISQTPVLHAIGSTVAIGAAVSLVLAALWARSPTSTASTSSSAPHD